MSRQYGRFRCAVVEVRPNEIEVVPPVQVLNFQNFYAPPSLFGYDYLMPSLIFPLWSLEIPPEAGRYSHLDYLEVLGGETLESHQQFMADVCGLVGRIIDEKAEPNATMLDYLKPRLEAKDLTVRKVVRHDAGRGLNHILSGLIAHFRRGEKL